MERKGRKRGNSKAEGQEEKTERDGREREGGGQKWQERLEKIETPDREKVRGGTGGGGREKIERGRHEKEEERRRETTLSPTLTCGSYESRGGRNPDYCSPDYNITRTDRPGYIPGGPRKIVPSPFAPETKTNCRII